MSHDVEDLAGILIEGFYGDVEGSIRQETRFAQQSFGAVLVDIVAQNGSAEGSLHENRVGRRIAMLAVRSRYKNTGETLK